MINPWSIHDQSMAISCIIPQVTLDLLVFQSGFGNGAHDVHLVEPRTFLKPLPQHFLSHLRDDTPEDFWRGIARKKYNILNSKMFSSKIKHFLKANYYPKSFITSTFGTFLSTVFLSKQGVFSPTDETKSPGGSEDRSKTTACTASRAEGWLKAWRTSRIFGEKRNLEKNRWWLCWLFRSF